MSASWWPSMWFRGRVFFNHFCWLPLLLRGGEAVRKAEASQPREDVSVFRGHRLRTQHLRVVRRLFSRQTRPETTKHLTFEGVWAGLDGPTGRRTFTFFHRETPRNEMWIVQARLYVHDTLTYIAERPKASHVGSLISQNHRFLHV